MSLHVLYAEDLRELRMLTRLVLKSFGCCFEACENGLFAWDRVRFAPDSYDLIITDHHMPEMNGLEFVTLLRTLPYHGKIMVFSSDINPTTAAQYRQLNVDRILNKPIAPQELRRVILELFPNEFAGALPLVESSPVTAAGRGGSEVSRGRG